jgi:uncharacterized protein (DUF1501 family)
MGVVSGPREAAPANHSSSRLSVVGGCRDGGALEQAGEKLVRAAVADRRATVAIVLFGGNDTNNMIVPYDDGAYAHIAASLPNPPHQAR